MASAPAGAGMPKGCSTPPPSLLNQQGHDILEETDHDRGQFHHQSDRPRLQSDRRQSATQSLRTGTPRPAREAPSRLESAGAASSSRSLYERLADGGVGPDAVPGD